MQKQILIAIFALLIAPSSYAANNTMLELLEVLRDGGTINQQAYEVLRDSALANEEQTDAKVQAAVKEEVKTASASMAEFNTKGKFEARSQDGDFSWRLGGRIMHDVAFWDDDGGYEEADGSEFRRARLYMSGHMWKHWQFKFQYDFADADATIAGVEDAYVQYTGFKPINIKIGQFKEPFSMEVLTSSKYIGFIERNMAATALGDAPTFGARNPGIQIASKGSNWTAAGGLFATRQRSVLPVTGAEPLPCDPIATLCSVGVGDDPPRDLEDGWAITGRATYSPWHEKTRALHFGAAFSYRDLADGASFGVRERPEVHIGSRTVDTGGFASNDFLRWNAEAAWVEGPFSLQGEYLGMAVNSDTASGDPDFHGFSLQGSWFLTGESKNYKFAAGAFGSVKPRRVVGKGGIGAWEVGARYTSLDLNDGPITGGKQENLTLGVNWYANANIRFMANYVHVLDIDSGPFDGTSPSAFTLRSQVHW